jgi:galactokinase
MNDINVSAPGRVCLFGEHQDYLGLPVIAAAINLRIGVNARSNTRGLFALSMPDTGEEIEIDSNSEQAYAHHRDYLRSAVNVLRRQGLYWQNGYDIVMRGNIPINAGVSSSSAMVIMWLKFLLETCTPRLDYSPEDLARWGYETEVLEFRDPGGMMDHYCAALGGVLRIDTRSPFAADTCAVDLTGIVLGHSLEPKATLETIKRTRQDVAEGITVLKSFLPDFDLASTPLQRAEEFLPSLQADPARRLRTNLVNRDLTARAGEALAEGNTVEFGALLSKHHTQLRDGLGLSTPKIERMLEASMAAGALGGKINGSGGGGCMFAYAPGCEEAVAEALRSVGGVPYIVKVDEGARIDA